MISTFRRPEYEKPVMTPEFSEMIDPVFLHVIDLLERIGTASRQLGLDRTTAGSQASGRSPLETWRERESVLAGQALIYWIDEMLIMTDWEGQDWWNNNKLETEILDDSNDRYRFFYRDAREAAGLPDKSALEVYYLCVALGFRGLYRDPESDASMSARELLQLPPTLEQWLNRPTPAFGLRPRPRSTGSVKRSKAFILWKGRSR